MKNCNDTKNQFFLYQLKKTMLYRPARTFQQERGGYIIYILFQISTEKANKKRKKTARKSSRQE